MNNTHSQSEYSFTIRSVVEGIIAVDFKEDSLQATPSFLIPDANGEELPLMQSQGEERRTTTNTHDILISRARPRMARTHPPGLDSGGPGAPAPGLRHAGGQAARRRDHGDRPRLRRLPERSRVASVPGEADGTPGRPPANEPGG